MFLSKRSLGTKNRESADQIYSRLVVMVDTSAIGYCLRRPLGKVAVFRSNTDRDELAHARIFECG